MRALPLLLTVVALGAQAQIGPRTAPALPDSTAGRYGTSGALVLILSEYGLGIGGAARGRLSDDVSITAEIGLGAGRDEREQSFPDGVGGRITPLKRNYVLLLPIQIGAEVRLFRRSVEDNFRPFVYAAAGPSVAYQWPYFDDVDRDGQRDEDEALFSVLDGLGDGDARLGIGGTLAAGAYFGRSRTASFGLRFGVQGTVFPAEVDLLERLPDVEDPSRTTFWTPVVSFHVVRLWAD